MSGNLGELKQVSMDFQAANLEQAWDDLLSRDAKRIYTRYASLDSESQKTVLEHLTKMAFNDGWHPEQTKSAQSALKTLMARKE